MKTTEEMERPVKLYELEAIGKQLSSLNGKVDQLLEGQKDYVTHLQLADSEKRLKEHVETKYGPIYKLFWTVLSALVVACGLIAFQLQKG